MQLIEVQSMNAYLNVQYNGNSLYSNQSRVNPIKCMVRNTLRKNSHQSYSNLVSFKLKVSFLFSCFPPIQSIFPDFHPPPDEMNKNKSIESFPGLHQCR